MASVAFGVPNQGTTGTTAQHVRMMLGRIFNQGVVSGCAVSGQASMSYRVAQGLVACSRGSSDGVALAWVEGGSTPTVSGNQSEYPRVDAVWVEAHDATQGDSDSLVTLGVTQGTAAASPAAPSIPAAATLVCTMSLPAGATTTAGATVWHTGSKSRPIGGSLGVLLHKVNTETRVSGAAGWKTICEGDIGIPTRRTVRIDVVTCAKGVKPNVGTPQDGSMHVRVLVDGSYDKGMGYERQLQSNISSDSQCMVTELDAGRHTITLQAEDGTSGWQGAYGSPNGSNSVRWQGQVIVVTDIGAA